MEEEAIRKRKNNLFSEKLKYDDEKIKENLEIKSNHYNESVIKSKVSLHLTLKMIL
jgi:hypothetical protein